jgi:hypothetical protein
MADNEVSIIMKAIDKASAVIDGVSKTVKKLDESKLGNLTKELTGVNLSSLASAAGIAEAARAIYKFATESIDVTVKFGNEVEELTRITGDSAESTSRLIQAADDMRLTEDALKASLLAATRQGIDVSIASLMKMADQYNKLKPGLEQANYLTKNFGRNGAEMARILELGSSGLKAKMEATSDSIVMDKAAVESTKEYQASLDALNDSIDGVKNSIGKQLIPQVSDLDLVLSKAIDGISEGTSGLAQTARVLNAVMSFGLSEASRAAVSGYADSIRDAEKATAEAGKTAETAADRFDKMDTSLSGAGTTAMDAATAMQKYNTQLLYNIASQGLDAESALLLAQKMGLVDDATVTATQKAADYKEMLDTGAISLSEYNNLVAGLAQYLDQLKDKTVTVHLLYDAQSEPSNFSGYKPKPGATQTAHANGGSWMIPMGYGYEGYRMPGGQTASGGETVTITPKGKESATQITLTDESLKKIGEAAGKATALSLMQWGLG